MSKPNMIKRADGSYSKHGLWDSIRENKGSGKTPTKEMLKQEKKIKSEYGDGGTIHIKPENKGKFNATKKATGKTTEELTHSKNPVTKKRAIFAQNAAKWKHEEGGEIEKLGTDNTNVNIPKKDLTISRFKTGSRNYNEIPEAFRNLPLQTGKVDDASLDAVQALTGIGALARAGKIGYGAYQLSKPNIINLSKTYRPTYNNALRQAGQALLPFAEGGEIDPKNTFGLTGNYSRTPNPEAIESNYKLAADYQRRLGNFNAGLNANLGFDHNLPLNTEQFNGSPTIIPNANLGLNVDYDRNNNNFSGSFNYNPINQGINAEVTYKKRFADGGKTVINPIITKPITTLQDNTVNNFPQIKQKTDSSFNSNKDSLGQFFDLVGLRPTSYQSKTPIPFTQTSPKISKNISVDPEIENRNKQISVLQNEIKAAEQSYYKQKKEYDNFMNSSKKEPIPVPAPMPISIPEEITPIPQYRGRQGNATMDENWVLEYAKGGRVLPKYLVGGFNVGLGNKSSNLFTKNYAATPAGFGQTPATTSSNTTNAPQTNTTNAKTRNNNAAVGAGLGFAGDTTNLLFDNNVFGTRNEVTDSEGNVLGEAQSDAGSQTQGALSGALKGASAGAALGPWGMAGGALIGGVAGFLTADTGAEDKLNQIKRERNAQISFKNMLGKGPIENNSIQTNSQSLYANGGMKTLNQNHPEATEEVELGESAMLPNGMNLAFGGETHENGGLETNLPEGTRIFSDRIKSGKRTIASIAKPIQNKIEKLKDNNSKAGQNTIKLFENQLDNLFNEQEEIKQQQDMAQQRKYFAKGGTKKSDVPGLGSINPKTGKPFTIEEIALNSNSTMQKPFGSEYAGNGNIYNGVQSRSFIPSVSITPNPSMTATDYQPSVIEKPFMLRYNGQPNYVPTNSTETRLPFGTSQSSMMTAPMNDGTAIYNNPYLKPGDVQNQMILNQNNRNELVKTLTSKTATPTIVDPTSTYTDNFENTFQNTPPPSEPRFNKGDIGTAGALGTSLLGNLIQRSNLNKVAPPRTLVAPTFTAGRTPVKADYSADLQSADNQFNAARRGVMMNSGNYSTQAGNLGQLRAEQLRNRSKILQNQNNANAVLMNEYQKAQADAINKNALSNYTTDQENMENLYNYNLWKTGQTNAADASAFNTSGQMFNNMVTGQNQLDAAEMYRRMYAQKVRDDLAFKAMGGTVRNYFAKGGTVYSQKLQNVLKEDTNTKAAQMDAEYASYLDAKGQPLQDTFKSKVTGLDYKVLPRKEKDLYATKLWEEAHGSAPTKSQVAATTKAIEGKKTSSPGAKTVAQMMSDKFSVSDQEANLVNAVNADREDTMSYLPKKEKAPTYKGSELKRQGAQLLDAVGSLGFTAIGNPLYQYTGTDLGFGHTDLSDEAVDKKLKNPYEYTTAAENAMIGIMGGKALSKIGGYMLPKASKIINAAARTEELAATKLSDKAFKSSRTKFSNKQSKNWVENGGRQRKLDMESTPEFLNKKRNSILEQEDEAFIQSKNNKMLEQKLKISEGADRYPKRSLEKMNKNLDNQEIPTAKEIENLERYSKNNKKLEDKLNFAENELDNTVIKAKEKKSNIAIKSLETRMKNAKKAGDVDKFNSLKSKYLKLMEMEQ
jgi:hypothetical protein